MGWIGLHDAQSRLFDPAGLTGGLDPQAIGRAAHWVIAFAGCAPLLAGCIALWLLAAHGPELGLARRR